MQNRAEKRKISGGLIAFAIVAILLACIVCGVCAGLLFVRRDSGRIVSYPDLSGSLESQLPSLPEFIIKKNYIYSDIYPRGVIISQSPEGLSQKRVSEARPEIVLSISLGRESTQIPVLSGMRISEAQVALCRSQCRIKTVKLYGEEDGVVIRSLPDAGDRIYAGDTVVLYVGAQRRSDTVCMPELAGEDRISAEELLGSLGLECEVRQVCDIFRPRDIVISQEIPAGSRLMHGDRVIIYINTYD